jgi:hypothetical protein
VGVAILAALMSAGILSGILNTITGLIAQYSNPAVFAATFLELIFPLSQVKWDLSNGEFYSPEQSAWG